MQHQDRFKFISHALNGDGPFRPKVFYDQYERAYDHSESYLVKYPRESQEKFARRCEVAWYSNPFYQVTSRYISHISAKSITRDLQQDLYSLIADDIDGKGNNIDVFWAEFMLAAKARGSMLLLVDMPPSMPENRATQLSNRVAPYWTPIFPETVTDYQLGDDGTFDYVKFSGNYTDASGESHDCTWHFTREYWQCINNDDVVVDESEHPLGTNPVLIFTEAGDFPSFGSFASIADMSKRLFNLNSELDEILRAQTFSVLTMPIAEDSTDEQRIEAAKTVGETLGTANLLLHTGASPSFIAPPDGPAQIYLQTIEMLKNQINETGLVIGAPNQAESGIAMQMRFQALNASLAKFAQGLEDLERRAWELSARWLGLTVQPIISWPREFDISDINEEMRVLEDMIATNMPSEVIIAQRKKIISIQFQGLDADSMDELYSAVEQTASDQV